MMFNRGNGFGLEGNRYDNTFYRGIVVDNNDPAKLNRVRIFIPEISNQPYDDWFSEFDAINVKAPGTNVETDNWSDIKMFSQISQNIPWAEPCYPMIGESSNFRFYKEGEISTISDCNYVDGFQTNDKEPPSLASGSFSPAFLYENGGTRLGDAFNSPLSNFTVKCNPYSFSYNPAKHVNKSKGLFAVPEVGAKVWVFHYEGDLNFPVYFGVYHDFRELSLINDTDNEYNIGAKYPNKF
jgi:hypothetical protein